MNRIKEELWENGTHEEEEEDAFDLVEDEHDEWKAKKQGIHYSVHFYQLLWMLYSHF
jgi:hypothetical protein